MKKYVCYVVIGMVLDVALIVSLGMLSFEVIKLFVSVNNWIACVGTLASAYTIARLTERYIHRHGYGFMTGYMVKEYYREKERA